MMWVWRLDQESFFSHPQWMVKLSSSCDPKMEEYLSNRSPPNMQYCTILTHIFDSIFVSHKIEADWQEFFPFQPLQMNIRSNDWGGFIQDAFGDNGYFCENFNSKNIKFGSLRGLASSLPDTLPLVNCFQLYEANIGKITEYTIGALYEHLMSEKTRTSTGAFYTPQNITQFLAKKAIFHQLTFHQIFKDSIVQDPFPFNMSHSILQLLQIEYDSLSFKEQENWLISLYYVLTSLRILDPAMGSGHFLIGVIKKLQEIYEFWWNLAKIQSSEKVKSFLLSQSLFQPYFTDFPTLKQFQFIISLNILLPKQIYGVDINPEAVIIAKLRCFMTLISSKMYKFVKIEGLVPVKLNIRRGNSLTGILSIEELQNKIEEKDSFTFNSLILDDFTNILKQIIRNAIELYKINLKSQKYAKEFLRLYPNLHHLNEKSYSIIKVEKISHLIDEIGEILNLNLNSRLILLNEVGTQHYSLLEKYYKEIYHNTKNLCNLLYHIPSKNKSEENNQDLFHWLIEFPEIFLRPPQPSSTKRKTNNLSHIFSNNHSVSPGFHVILGNPPYGNLLSHKEKNFVSQYASFPKEISSVFIERALNLNREKGVLNFITSYVLCFSKDLSQTRAKLASTYKVSLIASFDRDKCRFFEGMTQSISLLQGLFKVDPCKNTKDSSNHFYPVYTTSMYRKKPSLDHLSYLKANDFLLGKMISTSFNQKHRLPKCGDPVIQSMLFLFQSYSSSKNSVHTSRYVVLGDILSAPILLRAPVDLKQKLDPVKINKGEVIWYRISGNYWYNAWDQIPYYGTQIAASNILVSNLYLRNWLLLVFNSSFFYTWYRIYSDGRHMNTDIWRAFPLPDNLIEKLDLYNQVIDELASCLMKNLFLNFDSSHNRFNSSEIKIILDICDILLGVIYQAPQKLIAAILSWEPTIRGGSKLSPQDQDYYFTLFSNKKSFPLSSDQFAKFKETLGRNLS
ncbi:hypothetical protein WKT22_02640 [Candidatus Lokiarchaeum ossiferum]